MRLLTWVRATPNGHLAIDYLRARAAVPCFFRREMGAGERKAAEDFH